MKRIIVVEDDRISQKYIRRALEGTVEISIAGSMAEGLQFIEERRPDVLILDVELPDGTGYDICAGIRAQTEFKYLPILFISGHASLEERIKGYEVGGDDYITKPFDSKELTAKVKALLRQQEHKHALQSQFSSAQATAMESLTGASEMGLIVQFVERTYSISNYDQLANAMFDVLNRMGLNCLLMFQTDNEKLCFTSEGDPKPLEEELIKRLASEGRFFDFGVRTQVNYPAISCLVKNMPIEEQAKYGRYKDLLPPILACANQKVLQIEMELLLQDHTMRFSASFANIRTTLNEVASQMKEGQESGSSLLQSLLTSLDEQLPTMGLDDDQEKFLLDSVEEKVNEAIACVKHYETTQGTFDSLITLLQHLVDEQENIVDRLVSKTDLYSNATLNADDSGSDLELF